MPRGSGHVHKYQKVNAGVKKEWLVYRCVLARCQHYLTPAFISGKESICFACSERFIIGGHNKDQVKLKCAACTTRNQEGGTPLARTPAALVVAGTPPLDAEDVLAVGSEIGIDRLLKQLGPKEE